MNGLRSTILLVILFASADLAPAGPGPGDRPVKQNRLAKERSPYLRQHSTNPVDWYPWAADALERARKEDLPIFLSVGYAACHWCHVMEHESFEDAATAKLLNETFVNVKVDREERPDIDRIYMIAVQALTGRGGWPMTVLLLPDGRPFWGGTYLPRDGLQQLVREIARLWKEDRSRIENAASRLAESVRSMADGPDLPEVEGSDAELLRHMRNALQARFDTRHGGYGTRPKFPPHTELLFFLEDGGKRASDEELQQVETTLDAMAAGGIHDHVGGGFHRYSTDERWLLPHFEKMLYDNALLAQAYAAMHARTKAPRYRRVVERLFAWLEREMKRPGGGYASSLDADTDGEEGLTYTWTQAELEAALGADDAAFAARLFGFEAAGNFHDEASGRPSGRNIVHLPASLEDAARGMRVEEKALAARMERVLETLLAVRAKRAQPGLDDKVIAGWNGLLLSGFARAGVALEEPAYLERGRELATFLLERSRREDGTLLRFPVGSGPEIVGFCEDHVHVIEGLLDLTDATGEDRWAQEAEALARRLLAAFMDTQSGGFWTTSADQHETLFARSKEVWDSPIPSDNGTAARLCLRLYGRTKDEAFREAADRTLAAYRPVMGQPRMASGIVALFRALAARAELESAGQAAAVRGDAHVRQDVAVVDVFLERDEVKIGGTVGVVVRVHLDPGWHANANEPGEGLVGVTLATADKAPATLEKVAYPEGVARALGSLPGASRLYEGVFEIRATLAVPADVPAGPRKLPLLLELQACDENQCKEPMTIRLELHLRYGEEDGPARHPGVFGAGR